MAPKYQPYHTSGSGSGWLRPILHADITGHEFEPAYGQGAAAPTLDDAGGELRRVLKVAAVTFRPLVALSGRQFQ